MIKTYIILDTHILLWTILSPEVLNDKTRDTILKAQKEKLLLISCITLWEIAMLIMKRKINVFVPINSFLDQISEIEGVNIIQISPNIAADSCLLPGFHGDPADRIITATTRDYAGTLITHDKKIINWANSSGLIRVFKSE